MTAEEVERDRAMEARVARTLEDAGLAAADVERVRAAHRLAMAPRRERLGDPHHPDFLHPGRTVLVLVLDTGFRDPVGLAAAALLESEDAELRVPEGRVRAELGDDVAGWLAAVPLPGEGASEALVLAPEGVRLVALAERLDHCRHVRFRSDRRTQERFLEEAVTVYGPVAERTHLALARRFAHWAGAFARTLERAGPRPGSG